MTQELGDCILHADHHGLSGECYDAIMRRFSRYILVHDLTYAEAKNQYTSDYEAVVLANLVSS